MSCPQEKIKTQLTSAVQTMIVEDSWASHPYCWATSSTSRPVIKMSFLKKKCINFMEEIAILTLELFSFSRIMICSAH